MTEQITHTGPLWRWSGGSGGSWHFLTIDGEAGEALSGTALMRRMERTIGGFGSLMDDGSLPERLELQDGEYIDIQVPRFMVEAIWTLPPQRPIEPTE